MEYILPLNQIFLLKKFLRQECLKYVFNKIAQITIISKFATWPHLWKRSKESCSGWIRGLYSAIWFSTFLWSSLWRYKVNLALHKILLENQSVGKLKKRKEKKGFSWLINKEKEHRYPCLTTYFSTHLIHPRLL